MKAAIYSRKSKFTGKGESIENQIQLCRNYAQAHNITDIVIYEDEGFSGGNTNRPKFKRLMQDVKNKNFDVLICYRLDRISRNVADFSTTLEILQKYGIDFVSIKEQFDTSTPMGRAMIYIASVFAQLERETIAERIRDNMIELAKTGRWLGGVAPLGYKSKSITYMDSEINERKLSKLTQDLKELEIVKLIFDKYLEFKSLSKVETYMQQSNIKTKRNSNFTKSNLSVILTNTVYAKGDNELINYLESQEITCCGVPNGENGLLTYNKQKSIKTTSGKTAKTFRDKSEWIAAVSSHKGIIDSHDWIKVQKILLDNKEKYPTSLGQTHNALLSKVLRCAKCGSRMRIEHGHLSKKTGQKHYYYVCTLKKSSKGVRCDNKNGKVREIDPAVLTHIQQLSLNKKSILYKIAAQNKKLRETSASQCQEHHLLIAIEDKEKQIDNLMDKLAIDDSIADIIINKIKKLKIEADVLKSKLSNLNQIKKEIDETEISLSFISMLLDKCSIIKTLTKGEKQQIIESLVDKITYDGYTHEVGIDIIGSGESKKK